VVSVHVSECVFVHVFVCLCTQKQRSHWSEIDSSWWECVIVNSRND